MGTLWRGRTKRRLCPPSKGNDLYLPIINAIFLSVSFFYFLTLYVLRYCLHRYLTTSTTKLRHVSYVSYVSFLLYASLFYIGRFVGFLFLVFVFIPSIVFSVISYCPPFVCYVGFFAIFGLSFAK